MLMAISDRRQGETAWRSGSVLERRFRGHVFRRERLRFDTRFSPPARKRRGVVTFFIVLRGELSLDGGVPQRGPVAYLLAEDEREFRVADAPSLQAWGDVWDGVELQLEAASVRVPAGLRHGPLPLSTTAWQRLQGMADALEHAGRDPIDVAAGMVSFVEALATEGLVAADLPGSIVEAEAANIQRLWKGLVPLYAEHQVSATLAMVRGATGLSLTQLGRDIVQLTRTFGLFGQGYREALRVLRLRAAVLWLSSPELTVTDVSRIVGYRSTEAMARAFRDAKLPAPTVVQAAVRCPLDGHAAT